MTIQIPNVGTGVPADQTGDSPWLAMKKVADNFSNNTHAASRLVGGAAGNLMEVGLSGLASNSLSVSPSNVRIKSGFGAIHAIDASDTSGMKPYQMVVNTAWTDDSNSGQIILGLFGAPSLGFRNWNNVTQKWGSYVGVRTTLNTTVDANGFLKGASPVVDMYDNKIDLNHDAEQQGSITFKKLGVGDYLLKGSLGFAQKGWHIETPKDTNGNVLVAVVETQLENNDLSIKTYAKRFDDETGDIVANLAKPRDIPTGRFISLRLHELPKEPPVMPTEV